MKKLNLVKPDSGFVVGYIIGDKFYQTLFGLDLTLEIENNQIKQWVTRNGGAPKLELIATIEGDTVRTENGAIFLLKESA